MRAGGGVWAGGLRGEVRIGTGRRISRVVLSAWRGMKATGPAGGGFVATVRGERLKEQGCPAFVRLTSELTRQEGTGKAMGYFDSRGYILS